MFYVYALFNAKHSKLYIGQTRDLVNRIDLHISKVFGKSYTARYDGSWDLVYKESCATRDEALKREKQLKSYRGRQFIKSLIKDIPL
jgi:putative endonuclease